LVFDQPVRQPVGFTTVALVAVVVVGRLIGQGEQRSSFETLPLFHQHESANVHGRSLDSLLHSDVGPLVLPGSHCRIRLLIPSK